MNGSGLIAAERKKSLQVECIDMVCAAVNDMPDCSKPRCLFIGVHNEGHPCGMKARHDIILVLAAGGNER